MVEYELKLKRNSRSGILQLTEYNGSGRVDGYIIMSKTDEKVVEKCRGLMRILNSDEMVFNIKGK